MQTPIVRFLEGTGSDHRGRFLITIHDHDDQWLEGMHDYIQWMFPLMEPSRSVNTSPVLTLDEVVFIRKSNNAQHGLSCSVERMQMFWGENDFWIKRYNHNHLRLTRVIKSLRMLSGPEAAEEFKQWLNDRLGLRRNEIDEKALSFWREA